jgi:DNA-binding response OmpR family regulator
MTKPETNILIIEDDALLAEALASSLKKEGYNTAFETTGQSGLAKLNNQPDHHHILILDWMLPDTTGVQICRDLRAQDYGLAILLLTGKDGADNKVEALGAGADDYLTKPFALAELTARVHALSRRPRSMLSDTLRVGKLVLNTSAKKIYFDGQEIPLTLKEFSILEYLMRHPNQVMTREQILDHVWDYDFDSFSNIVDVHVNNLRKKITSRGGLNVLETIRGVGYCAKS